MNEKEKWEEYSQGIEELNKDLRRFNSIGETLELIRRKGIQYQNEIKGNSYKTIIFLMSLLHNCF